MSLTKQHTKNKIMKKEKIWLQQRQQQQLMDLGSTQNSIEKKIQPQSTTIQCQQIAIEEKRWKTRKRKVLIG